jgi:GAF domain-containing protein
MAGDGGERCGGVLEAGTTGLTEALSSDGDVLDRTLRVILGSAASLPGADHVGFGLVTRGTFRARPTDDPVAGALDAAQATSGEGPAVEAVARAGAVDVPDLAAVPRWAGLAETAGRHGVRGVLALALTAHDGVLGVVTLYSRTGVEARGRAMAEAFAAQATVALFGAQRIAGLARAVTTRDVIGRAKGILMQRDGVDDDTAFAMLVEASQSTNIKLVDVAHWLVEQAGDAGPAAGGPRP